ncbi:MAG: conjugal transfer protein TraG N-terminal domain-containing protein, partial [Deltaproteobacteria bacterium]|nr:conjugal transfer protein TraG N-terminal domain-containing protein [Deltaproteobacteria bacterium]
MTLKRKHIIKAAIFLTPVFLFLLSSLSYASSVYEVYTYGNGDFLAAILNGVKMLMSDGSFPGLLKVAAVISLTGILAMLAFGQRPSLFMLAGFILILGVGYNTKINVAINDVVEANNNTVITDVPFALGYVAYATSSIGYNLTSMAETAFSLPDSQKFTKTGFGYGAIAASNLANMNITVGPLQQTLYDYLAKCVMPDVLEGYQGHTIQDIQKSNDLLTTIGGTNPARYSIVYDQNNPGGVAYNCTDAYTNLQNRMCDGCDNDYIKTLVIYEHRWGLYRTDSPYNNNIEGYVGDAVTNIVQSSNATAAQNINTVMIANALMPALKAIAASTGANSALMNLGLMEAEKRQKYQWLIVGEMAKKFIPVMRGIIEALLYGTFPFLIVLALTPLMATVARSWLVYMIWIQMWGPFYSILNFFVYYYTKKEISAIAGGGSVDGLGYGVSLATVDMVQYACQSNIAIAGIIAVIIPSIILAIIEGKGMGMIGAISQVTGVSSSAAAAGAEHGATGNVNTGEVKIGHSSFMDATGHAFNQTVDLGGGGYSISNVDSVNPDGTLVHKTVNRYGAGIGISQGVDPVSGAYYEDKGGVKDGQYTPAATKLEKGITAQEGAVDKKTAWNIAGKDLHKKLGNAFAVDKMIDRHNHDHPKDPINEEQFFQGLANKEIEAQWQAIQMEQEAYKEKGMKISPMQAAASLGAKIGGDFYGAIRQKEKNAEAMGLGSGEEGVSALAEFKEGGKVATKGIAMIASRNAGTKGFDEENINTWAIKPGYKIEKDTIDESGKYMVQEASYLDGKGSVKICHDGITETAFKNKQEG